MISLIDLHVHTTASDGSCSPTQVVQLALDIGLHAIAITDHDTTAGIAEAQAAAAGTELRIVPGIEISADYLGNEIHVLGYFIDPNAPSFQIMLDWAVAERDRRNQVLAEKLTACGYPVDLDALARQYPHTVNGRVRIAKALMEQGMLSSVSEGFSRLFGEGQPCYVPRQHFPFRKAVQVIRDAGGLAVLAHPLQYGYGCTELDALLEACRNSGMCGMEVWYAAYDAGQQAALLNLANHHGLAPTGGTDFHGANRPQIALGTGQGDLAVRDNVLTALEARLCQERA